MKAFINIFRNLLLYPKGVKYGADFEEAITATGFGKFHFCLLAIAGLIYANTAIGLTIVSFLLPAAECDFHMDSARKGWLCAAPMFGMVIGSFFWGCLADTKGRKMVLVSTLLIDGIVGIISSAVQRFYIFLACRVVNGFAVAGAMGIVFPYLGEFQSNKNREKILSWMELFWSIGIVLLPLIAWGIIPIKGIRVEMSGFSYDSWNWFVAACGVPSLLLGFWLLSFPESPKFMMECGDCDEALEVLRNIYEQNYGDDPLNYPIKSLRETDGAVFDLSSGFRSVRVLGVFNAKDLSILCSVIWDRTKQLCRAPHATNTVLTCIIQFGLTTSYFTLMVWFPELFDRFEDYEATHAKTSASVCDVANHQTEKSNPFECGLSISDDVYMHTVIVGLACLPSSLWLILCVNRLGNKFFMIFSLTVAGVSLFALFLVRNSDQNLVVSCIFEAMTSLATSVVFSVLVDLYPTNLRVMAASFSLTVGRLGGLVGNLGFGFLIDLHCVVPIVLFGVLLFLAALLSFFLPNTGEEALE